MTVHATKKVFKLMSLANILAIQRLSRQNQSVTEASFSPEQELSQITQYQHRGMEIKLKISDLRDIRREGTTSDVKRLHVMKKRSLPLVFMISTFYRVQPALALLWLWKDDLFQPRRNQYAFEGFCFGRVPCSSIGIDSFHSVHKEGPLHEAKWQNSSSAFVCFVPSHKQRRKAFDCRWDGMLLVNRKMSRTASSERF